MPRLAFDVDDRFSEEFDKLIELTGASSKADAFRKAVSLYRVVEERYQGSNNSDDKSGLNNDQGNIAAIFAQIEQSQAMVDKEQKEIKSLAEETDNLLNQLASQVN